jgi:hypothetical protein
MGKPERGAAIASAVAERLQSIPRGDRVLIFTHKGDERKALQSQLLRDLAAYGIDVNEQIEGKRRLSFLTWGNETSLNGKSDCKHVILCGITRRSPLDLAASVAAQRNDLSYRMQPREAKAVLVSEMAHCVLQAMCRGTCRRVDGHGEALPMTLTIFGGIDGLAEALASSLPGIRWEIAEVRAAAKSRTAMAATQVCEHLQNVPDTVNSISITSLKRSLGLTLGADAVREAVNSALIETVLLSLRGGSRWMRGSSGRSLDRVRQ